ncbi:hypothetical protein CABS01_05341 [Colletotrichum abscissum]|uniref:Uncharacterized protein n=1 Tax=Colletotrichum costaricense TaxID=1209916 RepID=A0AAI9YXD5_9PEZI|nr:uncharacterized protein CCOS01_07869 [Colletotrichum costaricense]XP_060405883.1 uncharacterized protein CABS01_05341 [Colletotrichum abscissum]KAK1523720.1 hypothetical protein CABS01_05341 [Colletotrichum abscissum]KAK1527607.1 hypothetical protein CCOS01_07869 [Colletotrichum costaricense]
MSYPYPSHFLPLGSDMEVPNSGFAPSYDAPGSGQASMDQGTHEPTDQERRDSILQASRRKSKRSMNKPNVRLRQANISDSSQSGQAGDKKRNKLGYHRTSVACVPVSSTTASSQPYDFANPQITNWASPDVSSNYATKPGDLKETKKSYAEQSPITPSPSFSPYTSQAPPSASWSNADINAQNNMGYSSFTIGNPMAYPRGTQIPTQYPTMSHQGRQFPRRSSAAMTTDMYTNPIATSFPTMDPHTVSMSAGANPPSGYGTWPQQQQQQQQPPYGYPRPSEGYDTWTTYDNSSGS